MVINLDKYDMKILSELDKNAKQSIAQISKKIHLNKNTTRFRIERLLDEKIIQSFYPIIDISKLGFISVRVYVCFFNTKIEDEENIISYLVANPIVAAVAELETEYDIMLSVIVKSIHDFELFWNDFKKKFRHNLSNEKINIFTRVVYFQRKYLSVEKINIPIRQSIGNNNLTDYDNTDIKLLSIIGKNSRLSSMEIYKLSNIPTRTILYRIKELERKGIITNYRIDIDISKINYEYYKLNLKLDSFGDTKDIAQYCEMHKNVVFIDYTLSEYDFEVDVEVKSKYELNDFITQLKKIAKIRNIQIIAFKKYHKINTLPEFSKKSS